MPKSKYPALVVAPVNLVPACAECNKAKLDDTPASPEAVTLHPYFDHVQNAQWLASEIQETAPASVRFFVEPPGCWADLLATRVRHHFAQFGLATLYAAQAATELRNIRRSLKWIFETDGETGVAAHLCLMAASRADVDPNSWQTTTYRALARSTWFCRGGFAQS